MKLKQKAVLLLTKTKTGEKIALSQRYRIVFFAAISFAFNLLYALYHCVLGIINLSFWFMVMCAFYGILATMRFSAVLCERNHHNFPSDDTEIFVMKFSGILLVALALVLATVSYISLSQNIAAKHKEIIMITIAAYTFYKIAMVIVKAIKQHKIPSPLLRTIRSSYAEVAASVLTLQRSMLVSFSSMSSRQVYFMNAITGAVVCLFILVLGISMILSPKRKKEYASWQNPKL